jgi:predicted MFS family arabinose efflux permease
MMIRTRPPVPTGEHRAIMEDLRGGLNYVRHERLLLTLTVLVTVSTFLAMPLITMLPAFAHTVLADTGGTPETRLSFLMACQGLGAIAGALLIGTLGRFRHMGRAVLGIQALMGLLIALFALSRTPLFSYTLIFLCGIAFMALFSMSFSIVQLSVPEHLRGRVVSIYMVALRGGGPLGALAAGYFADLYSAPAVIVANGALLALITGGVVLAGKARSLREL